MCSCYFWECPYPANVRIYSDDDYSELINNSAYPYAGISGLQAIKQEISCGYACIEMLANWQGKAITEESLYSQNGGKITTSAGSGFLNEMIRLFPEWETTRYVNIANTELLEKIYASLKNGFPSPVEFAAKDTSGEWTLHFGIVTAMDFSSDRIVVQNPYGYEETYTTGDFIKAVRYECYENMQWYFKAGFNMGLFHKNTVYIIAAK
jgi:hypothetical protein